MTHADIKNTTLTKLGQKSVAPIEADLEGWQKLAGNPSMKTWIEYTSEDGKVLSGWWSATPGTYHASYTALEDVYLIRGRIVITPDGGSPVEVAAGDSFVVEKTFRGTWEIKEEVFKHFVIKVD